MLLTSQECEGTYSERHNISLADLVKALENRQVRPIFLALLQTYHSIMTDIMHSYLGLAALATIGDEDLPAFDPMFCISLKARQNLKRVAWLS